MREGETPDAPPARSGDGSRRTPPFNMSLCEFPAASRFIGDVPFTDTIIVTPTELVRRFRFDSRCFEGSAYREEADYQMNLHVNGDRVLMTGNVHTIHLPLSQVRKPGARIRKRSRSSEVYWSVKHTHYFHKTYWKRQPDRNGMVIPRQMVLGWFTMFVTYRVHLRP